MNNLRPQEDKPMKFHLFFSAIVCPIWVITNVLSLIETSKAVAEWLKYNSDAYIYILLFLDSVSSVLLLVATVFLIKRKRIGVNAIFAYFTHQILYAFYVEGFTAISFASAVSGGIWLVIIYVYYKKRLHLFD